MIDNKIFQALAEPTNTEVCLDCGLPKSERGWVWTILYRNADGGAVWVCKDCQTKRDEESQARTAQAKEQVREMAWRDEWEE